MKLLKQPKDFISIKEGTLLKCVQKSSNRYDNWLHENCIVEFERICTCGNVSSVGSCGFIYVLHPQDKTSQEVSLHSIHGITFTLVKYKNWMDIFLRDPPERYL